MGLLQTVAGLLIVGLMVTCWAAAMAKSLTRSR